MIVRQNAEETVVGIEDLLCGFVQVPVTQKDTSNNIERGLAKDGFHVLNHFLVTIGIAKYDFSVLRRIIQVAAVACEQSGDVDQLARHTQLDVSNRPPFASSLAKLVREVYCHCAPVPGKVVLEKTRDAVARAFPQASILKQVPIQDISHDAPIRIFPAHGAGLEEQEQPSRSVLICVVFSTDLMDEVMAEHHRAESTLSAWLFRCKRLNPLPGLSKEVMVTSIGPAIN